MKFLITLMALLAIQVPQALASDDSAKAIYKLATVLYQDRDQPEKLEQAITFLAAAKSEVKNDMELKYDIAILHSRCVYFQGVHAGTEDEKISLFEQGIALADEAKALSDEYTEAYYFHALNLARWAEAKGVMASLGKKQELIDHLTAAGARITRPDESGEFQAGEAIDGYGPDRILGRILFKLPSFAGGSRERSLIHLRRAVTRAPEIALNHVYLADTLASDAKDRPEAIRILDALLKQDENEFNPKRLPETLEEFALGRKLRSELN